MTRPDRLTTTVSTKGQVILSKGIRQRKRWDAGTRLTVEDTEDGALLKAAPLFADRDRRGVRLFALRRQGEDGHEDEGGGRGRGEAACARLTPMSSSGS